MRTRYGFLRVVLSAAMFAGASPASAQLGTPSRPLEGRSLETVRALADYLDESTQNVVITAQDDAQANASQRAWASALNDFVRREAAFRQHAQDYDPARTNLSAEFRILDPRGRRVTSAAFVPRRRTRATTGTT